MKTKFAKTWVSSVQPRRQRKYRYNAPLHLRSSFLSVNLSKELRKKYGTRNIKVRTGDKVKILRGNFKGKEGAVTEIDMKSSKVYVAKIETSKREGAKARVPQNPSNLQIIDLILDDKKRKEKLASFKKPEEK
jgi:large subunit ribosomal protein L24